jgi:hypothetical protein
MTLAGVINENTPFPEERPDSKQKLIINCFDVQMVNSVGISQWINWMKKLPHEQKIAFRNCTQKVIDIVNYLEGFLLDGTHIESFFVPYECQGCTLEQNTLYTRGKDYLEAGPGRAAENRIPEEISCPQCKAQMEAAVLLKNYLRFLNFNNAAEK